MGSQRQPSRWPQDITATSAFAHTSGTAAAHAESQLLQSGAADPPPPNSRKRIKPLRRKPGTMPERSVRLVRRPRGHGGARATHRPALRPICGHCSERREGGSAGGGQGHAEHVLHADSGTLHQLRHTHAPEMATATDTHTIVALRPGLFLSGARGGLLSAAGGGGAHRPLTPSCPPSACLADPYLPTSPWAFLSLGRLCQRSPRAFSASGGGGG